MKKTIFALMVFTLVFACSAWAFNFSADVVSTAGGRTVNGKIYISNEKVRMEAAGTTTISRLDKKVVWLLMPNQNTYIEQPLDPASTASVTENMPGELERTRLGSETINGKSAEKYRIRYASNGVESVMLQWVDPGTKIPVKVAAEDGSWSTEYRNISLGDQPDDLFTVPSGYKKFELPNMEDMMKRAAQQKGS